MFTALLIALATYRLTRLLVADAFPPIANQRARIERRFGEDHWVTYLSQCAWCASMYVGFIVVLLADLITHVRAPVLTWLAASAVTGILSDREPE